MSQFIRKIDGQGLPNLNPLLEFKRNIRKAYSKEDLIAPSYEHFIEVDQQQIQHSQTIAEPAEAPPQLDIPIYAWTELMPVEEISRPKTSHN